MTGEKGRHQFVDEALKSQELETLRQGTVSNLLASELSAVHFYDQYMKLNDDKNKIDSNPKKTEKQKETRKDIATMKRVGKAIKQAKEEVAILKQMQDAMGIGCGTGEGSKGGLDTNQVAELFKKVVSNDRLRQILNRAGAYRLTAQAKQRRRSKHGYDDMVGVCQDDHIGRLLPVELAMLTDKDMELDTLRRLMEKQTLCRDYNCIEHLGKGPIIICVDESASMSGNKIVEAKAFALAMYYIAKKQKRLCVLASFTHAYECNKIFAVEPNKPDPTNVLDFMGSFTSGGTSLDAPLHHAPIWMSTNHGGWARGKTDMIIVTDGIVGLPENTKDFFLGWKKVWKARLISIIIQSQEAGGLREVSDETHFVSSISHETDAIQQCLSI